MQRGGAARDRPRELAAAESDIRFGTFDDGLAWQPGALVISTPPDHHHEYALEAARRDLHFFTEASVVPGETPELIDAVAGKPIVAARSCTLRFHPGIRTMRVRIAEGAIGRPLVVLHHVGQHLADWHPWEGYRTFYVAKRETGPAREIVPFELNWMTFLFGGLTSIQGVCAKVSALEVDVDDLYYGLVRFDSGVEGTLVVEVVSRPAIRCARIVGVEGTLIWDFGAPEVREWDKTGDRWTQRPDPPPVEGPGGTGWPRTCISRRCAGSSRRSPATPRVSSLARGGRPAPAGARGARALLERRPASGVGLTSADAVSGYRLDAYDRSRPAGSPSIGGERRAWQRRASRPLESRPGPGEL